MRISDWSSDVCSSDLGLPAARGLLPPGVPAVQAGRGVGEDPAGARRPPRAAPVGGELQEVLRRPALSGRSYFHRGWSTRRSNQTSAGSTKTHAAPTTTKIGRAHV